MKEETRKVYICEYCGKMFKTKAGAKTHENYCVKNPLNNHPCYDCKFRKRGVYAEYEYCSHPSTDFEQFACRRYVLSHYDGCTTEPMPSECKHYEQSTKCLFDPYINE